jgi:iron complex transport system substrate-binding protein
MNLATTNWLISTALSAAIFTLALFPPAAKRHPVGAIHIPSAQTTAIFPVMASGYTTINEGVDHIVAVSKPAKEWAEAGLLNKIYPALGRIPVVGSLVIPDPEQVLRLWPDAVFVNVGQGDLLKKTGLPGLVEIKIDAKNPIKSREIIWRQMGEVAGRGARAAFLLDRYAAKLAALRRQLSSDTARHVRVAFIHANNGEWWTTNRNYYFAYKLGLIGAMNVSEDFKLTTKADLEQLLRSAPDVIFFGTNPGDHTTLKEIAGRPEFQALQAVRERRIYKLPDHSFMNEPVEDPVLLSWMAEIFYPDVMPRALRNEYKKTYRDIYHYNISDDEIDKALYLGENRNSAGYERFVR